MNKNNNGAGGRNNSQVMRNDNYKRPHTGNGVSSSTGSSHETDPLLPMMTPIDPSINTPRETIECRIVTKYVVVAILLFCGILSWCSLNRRDNAIQIWTVEQPLEWWQTKDQVPTQTLLVPNSDIDIHPEKTEASISGRNSSSPPLRWGILGCGRIAHDFSGALKMAGSVITAVAAGSLPNPSERAAAFATRYNIPRSYGSYLELASDDQVDIVYVATTNQLHYDNVLLLLRAGKNVLVEKPIAVSMVQAQEMFETARHYRRLLLTNYWTRFFPITRNFTRHEYLSSQESVLNMHGDFSFVAAPSSAGTQRLLNQSLGGGAMLDLGCYLVCWAVLVASATPGASLLPVDVQAAAHSTIGSENYHVDTEISFVLKWDEEEVPFNTLQKTKSPFTMLMSGQASFRRPSPFQVEMSSASSILVLHGPANAPVQATRYDYSPPGGPLASITHVKEYPLLDFDSSFYPEQYPGAAGFVHIIRVVEDCMYTKGIPGRFDTKRTGGCLELEDLTLSEQLAIANITDQIMEKAGYWTL